MAPFFEKAALMLFRKPKWFLIAVIVTAALGGIWWLVRGADDAPRLRTVALERGSIQASVSSSGTVNPVTQVSVGSQVSGQIRELFADFNTEVKAQQLIARIDPESFAFKVRQAQADVDAARAAVLNAQANLGATLAGVAKAQLEAANALRDQKRKQTLLAQQFISEAEFDTARSQAAILGESLKVSQAQSGVAKAQVASAQAVVLQRAAVLAQAKVDLQRTEIRSPLDGVVIKRSVDVGQTVAASLQAPELFVIARSLADMQVDASIDEADIARVRPGQKAAFTVDAFAGRSFEGVVRQVRKAAVSAQNVVTYTVVIAFKSDQDLRKAHPARRIGDDSTNVRLASPPGAASASSGPPWGQVILGSGPATDLRADHNNAGAVYVSSDAEKLSLLPGMTASVKIFTEQRTQVLKVPNAALRVKLAQDEGVVRSASSKSASAAASSSHAGSGKSSAASARIYVLNAKGEAVAKQVRTGLSDGISTELISDADRPAGDESSKSSQNVLQEGAQVVVAVESAQGAAAAPKPATSGMPRMPF
jgi:HlyD family secretion protein